MNRVPFILLLLGIVGVSTFTVTAQAPNEKRANFLAVLKAGQPVSIKEVAGRYEISTFEGIPGIQGYKVLETGADHLVVQDIAGVTEIHIPVYSVKAIVRVKLPQK